MDKEARGEMESLAKNGCVQDFYGRVLEAPFQRVNASDSTHRMRRNV